jgi:hypothetical protein
MSRVLSRLPFWAYVGAIGGLIVGLVAMAGTADERPAADARDLVLVGVISGTAATVLVLLMLSGWLRYRLGDLALMTPVVSLVTGLVVIVLADVLRLEAYGPILGLVVGIIVGAVAEAILCKHCTRRRTANGTGSHA